MFYVVSQDWAILVVVVPLVAFNMWLTRQTYKLPCAQPDPHLLFCTVVGGESRTSLTDQNLIPGWTSFMLPCLSSSLFKQTTFARRFNYHYRRNISFTNLYFGIIFTGLAIYLNVGADSTGVNPCFANKTQSEAQFSLSNHSGNPLKKNHLFACYDNKVSTFGDLSRSHLPCEK